MSAATAKEPFNGVSALVVTDAKKKRPAPFSLRLNEEERAKLEAMAGRESLSSFIKARLFDSDVPIIKRRNLSPVHDQKLLGQVLGALGQSRLSQNMNQLAKAAHIGNLPLPEDVEKLLTVTCSEISEMRQMMMRALGTHSSPYAKASEDT